MAICQTAVNQVAPAIMTGAQGNTRTDQINNQYAYFAAGNNQGIQAFFLAADDFVRRGIGIDPTNGAIQFSHAASVADAEAIAQAINNCGQNVIASIISDAGVEIILNGSGMVAGSTNITVYINMNYTIPGAPSAAPSC
jgi:hypothetical protein